MEVSGGTLDDGDQDASPSLQTITTGAATDDPASKKRFEQIIQVNLL